MLGQPPQAASPDEPGLDKSRGKKPPNEQTQEQAAIRGGVIGSSGAKSRGFFFLFHVKRREFHSSLSNLPQIATALVGVSHPEKEGGAPRFIQRAPRFSAQTPHFRSAPSLAPLLFTKKCATPKMQKDSFFCAAAFFLLFSQAQSPLHHIHTSAQPSRLLRTRSRRQCRGRTLPRENKKFFGKRYCKRSREML